MISLIVIADGSGLATASLHMDTVPAIGTDCSDDFSFA